ncbi:MAG TPA: ferritin-like domain-containing protein [Vicinamibacterales bacterium]|nr:ferritin-like domain-containing protein [Vicinamibacterales bacterium]
MTETTTLKDLFIDELRDIYHAERQLVRALPKLAKAATSPDLREAIESHLAETEEQVSRIEQAFEMIDEPAKTKTCSGMLGIVEEGSDVIKENEKGAALDAGIIAGAQRAEHYEMAAYGTIMAWARALGHDDVAELLSLSLEEEKAADQKLTELAESGLNEAARNGRDESRQPAMAGTTAGNSNGNGKGRGASSRQRGGHR